MIETPAAVLDLDEDPAPFHQIVVGIRPWPDENPHQTRPGQQRATDLRRKRRPLRFGCLGGADVDEDLR